MRACFLILVLFSLFFHGGVCEVRLLLTCAIPRLSNRTDEWVRLLAVVLSSDTNKVPIEGTDSHKELPDAWLA